MSNAFGPKKPLFGPYTYRVKSNVNGDTLIAVYHGSKRVAHIDAFWAYSMRAIEEHEAEEMQRAVGGRRRRLVCASDLRALGAEGRYPNVLAVGHAFIDDEAYKGKGIGRAMYEAMMVEGFAVRQTRISGQPGPMYFIPDECKGAGNTSAEAQRVWASLARDYPSQGTSIRVDAPPVIGSRAKANPRRNLDAEVWYHGRKARSRKFDLQFVGGREATNQEGPGFYFTTSSEDASAYAYPNGIVLRAALNVPKWVSRTKRPVRSEIERLMRAAPDYEDALMNWDESPHRAHAKALASIMREPNQHAAFLTTWAEFYRRSGHSADYLRELASMGYGGVKARRGESQHAVVFSPAFVENVEVLEDLGTGPIENPRRQNYPRVVVALDQHLPQATAQVEAGFYFEEGGCVGMALALQRTLQRYGVTAPLALFPGSFKHAGVLVGKRFLDATGLGLQEVAAAPITRSRLLGVAKEWGKKAEDVLSDQEYAQQAIDLALEEGG